MEATVVTDTSAQQLFIHTDFVTSVFNIVPFTSESPLLLYRASSKVAESHELYMCVTEIPELSI